jgi:hypothetical protein
MKKVLPLALLLLNMACFCQQPLRKQLRVEHTGTGNTVVRLFPPSADSVIWIYNGKVVNADTAAWLNFEKNNNQDNLYIPKLPDGISYITVDSRYSWFPKLVPIITKSIEPQNRDDLEHLTEPHTIYSSCLYHYYENPPVNLVIVSITDNRELLRINFTNLAMYFGTRRNFFYQHESIDSSWIDNFKQADSLKYKLATNPVPNLCLPAFTIRIVTADSINKVNQMPGGNGFERVFGEGDKIAFSSIIYFKDRAIVEMSRYGGLLDGNGTVFFLEKTEGFWKVVAILPTWIS